MIEQGSKKLSRHTEGKKLKGGGERKGGLSANWSFMVRIGPKPSNF